jgi:hypothetical protein
MFGVMGNARLAMKVDHVYRFIQARRHFPAVAGGATSAMDCARIFGRLRAATFS